MLITFYFIVACHTADKSNLNDSGLGLTNPDTGSSILDTGDNDTAENDTSTDHHDPWPEDEVSWNNVLSLVYDGKIISSGESLVFTSPPAGIDSAISIRFTLTNRSDQALNFDPDPSAWLVAEGFSWASDPPTDLGSQESIGVELSFNPVFATEAMVVESTMTIPTTDAEYALNVEASIPRPLRIVLVGDDGYTLVSDSYGADFFYEHIPEDIDQTMLTATWGSGLFLRGSRFGGWSSEGFYEYSEDGIHWQASSVAGSTFPFACEYGLGEFLCVRGYGAYFTHSQDGMLFLHESINAGVGTFITDMVFNGNHFIGAGRYGTRAVAMSTESFDSSTVINDITIGNYNAIAQGQDLIVAVGGTDQYAISTSSDGGYSWTDLMFSPSNNARFTSVAFNGEQWLTHGHNDSDHPLYISYDGYDWQPVTTITTDYIILGAHNGWFMGADDNGISRSQDGENWDLVHSFPEGMSVVSMATEKWETP